MKTTQTGSRGDFLSTVIDRAHERAPLVAPRPASLFEPAGTASIVDAAESSESFAPPRAPPRVDVSPVRDAPPRVAPPRIVEPVRDAPRLAPPEAVPRIAHTLHLPIDAEAPPSTLLAAAVPAPALPALAPRMAPPSAEIPAPAARTTHDETPAPRRDTAAVPPPAAPSLPGVAALLPNPDVVAAFAAHAPMHAAPSRDIASVAPAAPVVTISIGRVDVRAPAAPPGAVRAPAAPRPAALSDYLGRKERAR